MGEFADGIRRQLIEQARAEFDAIGSEIADDVRRSISIPVVRRGKRVVERSKPGEPPRRDTGGLVAGIGYEVTGDDREVRLEVYATGDVAVYLNDGTGRMEARPFMDPAYERWKEIVPARLGGAR